MHLPMLWLQVFRLSCFTNIQVNNLSQEVKGAPDFPPTSDSSDTFRCSSALWIDRRFTCDGKADCDDIDNAISCGEIVSQGSKFKCKSKGCVDAEANCNETVVCLDMSDENPEFFNATTLPPGMQLSAESGSSCVLPQHPGFGPWSVHGTQEPLAPEQSVDNGTVLKIGCNEDHVLQGSQEVVCADGKWSGKIGQCSKTCPPRRSTQTMKVTCVYNDKETENCTEVVDGTLAKFKCADFYESPVQLCQNGIWNQTIPRCVPVCGGSNPSERTYPWHALVYKEETHFFSGSLISPRIVLTSDKGTVSKFTYTRIMADPERYTVAVGKHHKSLNDIRDGHAQYSKLEAVFVHPLWERYDINLGDVAVVVTKKPFTLSRSVQPVCLDRGHTVNVVPGDFGYVVGWKSQRGSISSVVLNELKIPIVNSTHCRASLPKDYLAFLTSDKFCAGELNKGVSVCRTDDAGGSLVFEKNDRFYLIGVLSYIPTVKSCDTSQYGVYTNVSQYVDDFILQKLAEYET